MSDARAVRRALLDLHRRLLEDQRRRVERVSGRMSGADLLQAATEDLRFDWLRELSTAVADLDAALAADPPADPEPVLDRLRALVAPPVEETAFGARYLQALQDDPDAVLLHRDLVAALAGR